MANQWWRVMAIVLGSAIAAPAAAHAAEEARVAPIVPGYYQIQKSGKPDAVVAGQLLLGELNCTACHRMDDSSVIDRKGAPDLSRAGERLTPQYIRAYLSDPHGIKPGATMPDVLHGLDAAQKAEQVDALTHYLVSLGGPLKLAGDEASVTDIDRGRSLFHSIGCVACHAPEKGGATKIPSVPLWNLGMKTTVTQLAAFLLDPVKVRPASRMPNFGLTKGDAIAIAAYLLREQFENPENDKVAPARAPGLRYEYYGARPTDAKLETLNRMKISSKGRATVFTLEIPHHTPNDWAVKFTGALTIPTAGKYTFYLSSDDGSHLYIDGQDLIDDDGIHPAGEKSASVELTAGDHPIVLTYFQAEGESVLSVGWEGPGIPKQSIPPKALSYSGGRPLVPLKREKLVLDQQKVAKGRTLFQNAGCASCHTTTGIPARESDKQLMSLKSDGAGGCLSDNPSAKAAQYNLAADQIAAIRAALGDKERMVRRPEPVEMVAHTMAAFNCYACHNRDGIGGPAPDRNDYFVMSGAFDMGDEGRIPPRLTHVGAKLQQSAIEQIVFAGKLHVRPVLATRMPMFSQERLGYLPETLAKADAPEADTPPAAPQLIEKTANAGRRLVGTKGLGCVNCHGVDDVKSLGMPAPNLSTASSRLRTDWFHKLLENPSAVNPGTRMPAFWDHGEATFKDVADGTMNGQISAIWVYLHDGPNMILPVGLLPSGGYELVPADETIVHRTILAPGLFSAKQGNRAILVGNPEMVHFGFDADAVRLGIAWRGRFFDAVGQWEGRGGRALAPLGNDLIKMPEGPSFATLASDNDPWPKIEPGQRNVGGEFKGFVLDTKERPTFHYILNGVDIQEQPLPDVQTSANLLRKFHLTSTTPPAGFSFLAASGEKIEEKSPGVYLVDGKLTVHVDAPGAKPVVRTDGAVQQVIVPVKFENGQSNFNVEISW